MIDWDLGHPYATTTNASSDTYIEITTYISTSSPTTSASRPTQVIRSYVRRSHNDTGAAVATTTKYAIVYRSSASTARPPHRRPKIVVAALPRAIACIERATFDRRDRWLRVDRRRG